MTKMIYYEKIYSVFYLQYYIIKKLIIQKIKFYLNNILRREPEKTRDNFNNIY